MEEMRPDVCPLKARPDRTEAGGVWGFWVKRPALGNGISAAFPWLPINASQVKAAEGEEDCAPRPPWMPLQHSKLCHAPGQLTCHLLCDLVE